VGTKNVPTLPGYSPEVLSYFRATGEGWQTRMDAALQMLVKKHPEWLKKLG